MQELGCRGVRRAVLTNGVEDQQHRKLRATGLPLAVDLVICSSSLSAGKPDPRAFHEALSRLGLAADEVLMVGDSVENDVRGASAVGIRAVLLDRSGNQLELASTSVITSLSEVPPLLNL